MSQQSLLGNVGVSWRSVSIDEANASLVAWGHRMGPMNRPDYGDLTAQPIDPLRFLLSATGSAPNPPPLGPHEYER